MLKDRKSKSDTDDLTATEVDAAIHYLEHQPVETHEHGGNMSAFVMVVIFLLMMGCLVFVLFSS